MLTQASQTRGIAQKQAAPIAVLGAILVVAFAAMLLGAAPTRAQLQTTTGPITTKPTPAPARSAPTGGGTRVFMSNSGSWKAIGGWGLAGQSKPGRGAPADADGVKAFEKHCSQYPLTNDRDAATFVILLDQLNTKKPVKGRDKVSVYDRAGIRIYSNSTRVLDDSIKDACQAIGGHAKKKKK